ncbi:MAG: trypsin-like peptidase domain-containing protein [Candidatus Omnitrophica bacterium]|nr:trypsin-like peptidase domain-containing protein [Candidatus Omnitrophota bacterium]
MKEEKENSFCSRPIGPWVSGILIVAVMLVFWVVLKRKEIIHGVESEQLGMRFSAPSMKGEPSFPGPVVQAAATNIQPAVITKPTPNGGPQCQGNQPSANYKPAAITKATPNGGMQLIAANQPDSAFQNSLKDAVNAIIPSVCDIHARRVVRVPSGAQSTDPMNLKFVPPFDGAIDKFIANKGYENIGAGIFVDQRGYILTNSHVTQEATDIVVTVFGNPAKDYQADIVAQDPKTDLALIKLRGEGVFPEVAIGDSSFVQIGDYVIAVGSPFGIEQTVTSGILSGIRKSIVIEGVRYQDLFQIDAAINRGSSGGPLVNMKGEVIGMNTAIYAPTGVFSGTGFSIPINNCKDFLTTNLRRNYTVPVDKKGMMTAAMPTVITATGVPVPVRFGIEIMPVNAVIAEQFGLGQTEGVLVNRVLDESPASFAGIMRGDIIKAIAGVVITGKDDVPKIVSHFKAGDNVNVRIFRNGKTDEILVKLQ